MNDLDTRIAQLLRQSSAAAPDTDDMTLREEILATFRGRHRTLMIPTVIKMVVAGLLFYACVWQFFRQDAMMPLIAWASAAIICVIVAATTLLFLWSQLNHNMTVREIKRLEVQCALLARALERHGDGA